MSQQNGFNQNNRTGMGRNSRQNPEMNNNQNTIRSFVDRGTQRCDIPINTFEQGIASKYVNFVAEVTIPKGFVLVGNDYTTSIALSGRGLKAVEMTQNCQCGNLPVCTTTKECILLNGLIDYNVVLENFRAACPVESVDVVPVTVFNDKGEVYIDRLLDCIFGPKNTACCNGGSESEELNQYYRITLENREEYITLFDGSSIYRGRDAEEFCALLNNPDIEKTIHIPYRLFIQSLKNEECNQPIM